MSASWRRIGKTGFLNLGRFRYTRLPSHPPHSEEVSSFERYLEDLMVPVQPRPGFVDGLRERLMTVPRPEGGLISWLQLSILAGIGLLSGVVLAVVGIKAVVALIRSLQSTRL